mmetsp:Transcript_61158/g.92480  ORF Transcript_61158/g.92480 Transcript_61158/m.92480 type:complete len:112 (+) Transcript_61158:389-724(+)
MEADESEDCLFMNIWAPSNANNLPIIFWIHGGGLLIETANNPIYNGKNMAKSQNVILVSIDFRSGLFGFSARNLDGLKGNNGLLDMVEGLKWVNKNIREFGGDPEKVTIWG